MLASIKKITQQVAAADDLQSALDLVVDNVKRAMRTDFCGLCATMHGDMTFHHLIPRATHSKRWCFLRFSKDERSSGVCLCRECHDQVHRKIDEKTLALEYNTLESLQTHPDLQSFVSEKAPWTWLVSPSRGARGNGRTEYKRKA